MTFAAIFAASRTCGLVSVSASNGASQASISRLSFGLMVSQISTRPGAASGSAFVHGPDLVGRQPAIGFAAVRTPCRPRRARFGPERNEWRNGTYCKSRSIAAQSVAKVRRIASNSRGAAPWNEKIDCFSSPTAKIVRLTARAPAPAKNSAVSSRTISHCFGLVSCASSISTWSMP